MSTNLKTKFKNTKFGLIPEQWSVVKVVDVADKIAIGPFGSTIKVETFVSEGVPVISGQHLKGTRLEDNKYNFITSKHAEKLHNAIVYRDDVIFTHAGNIGQVAYIPKTSKYDHYILSQRQFYLRCNKQKLLPQFVTYLFKSPAGQHALLSNRSQTGVPSIAQPVNHLKNIEIPLPPLNQQQQIAEILSSLDNKIELNRRINANLEAMASALFKKWFVDIGDGLPEGWKIKPLQEVFDFLEGPGIRNWQYAKSGTRFINIRLINGGDIDVASANFINQKDVDTKYKHFLLKSRDMVLSTSGTLGKSAIVRKAHLPLLLNTSVIRFRPKDKNNYPFMYQFLQSQSFLEEQTSMASGSVQANFGPTHLKKMFILMPDDKILKLYNDTCSALYEEITSNLDQNDKLQNLRDSLLPRLMNGRIKV